jgi:hypothetical protein
MCRSWAEQVVCGLSIALPEYWQSGVEAPVKRQQPWRGLLGDPGVSLMDLILIVLVLLLLLGGGGGYYYGGPALGGGIGGLLLIVLIVWLLVGNRRSV